MILDRDELARLNARLPYEQPATRAAIQQDMLDSQVDYCASMSEFYRDRLAAGSAARRELAFTSKDELRTASEQAPPFGTMLCLPRNQISRVCSTSGTTGRPLYYTASSTDKNALWLAWQAMYTAAGLTSDDLALYAFALGGPFGSALGGEALEFAGIPTIPAGAAQSFDRFNQLLTDLHPTVLLALSSFPLRLGQKLREAGTAPEELGVAKMVLGGEPTGGFRRQLESDWGTEVFETMGMGEFGMIWAECELHQGMHDVTPALTFVEYLDPETGQFAERPETGGTYELVYSSLNRTAMPILRYRSRDLVVIQSTSCACGRTTPALYAVGRSDDMIKVRGTNIFPAGIERLLSGFGEGVRPTFRIVLPPDGSRKYSTPLLLRVAWTGRDEDTDEVRERLEIYLRSHLNVRSEVILVAAQNFEEQLRGGMGRREFFETAVLTA